MKGSFVKLVVVVLASAFIIIIYVSVSGGYVMGSDVRVVIPPGFLKALGFESGTISVSMLGVDDFYSWTYNLSSVQGSTIRLNLSKPVGEWLRLYSGLNASGLSSVTLPTVSITLFLYDDSGELSVATYMYSAEDYFRERVPSLQAPLKAAGSPLEPFKKPLVIKLSSGLFKASKIPLEAPRHETPLVAGKTVPEEVQAVCQPSFTQTWYQALYDSSSSPPQGWISNVLFVSDQDKRAM